MKELVSDYLSHITVGSGQHYKNMAVFPLIGDRECTIDYLLLDEALATNLILITEVGNEGRVPELKVENRSEKNILILDGEELVGAKQNRIVNVSLLIAAHSSLTIPVSCVEQGRWSYQSNKFMSRERVMPPRMRMRKNEAVHASLDDDGTFAADQGETWDMIHEKQARLGIDSATGALGDTYEQVQDIIGEYMKHFTVDDRQAGILVIINNRVIGCDCFGRHDTLRKVFPKLVRSYVLDAIDVDKNDETESLTSDLQASSFLAEVGRCLIEERPSISLGTDVRLVSQTVIGAALSVDDDIIHLTAFAKDEAPANKKLGFYQRASRRRRTY